MVGKEVLQQAESLAIQAIAAISDKRDNQAARILYEAERALAQMRVYCKQARDVHFPLLGFSIGWPEAKRHHLRDVWVCWRTIYDVLYTLEDARDMSQRQAPLLTNWRHHRDAAEIDALRADLAAILQEFLQNVAYKIKQGKIYILETDFDNDEASIRDVASMVLDTIEGPGEHLVGRGRPIVFTIREKVLAARPKLPADVWRHFESLAGADSQATA